jgi:(S)-ureidoglycine aminohydrolase
LATPAPAWLRVTRLITPENHVTSSVPGITGATSIVLINPAMGARFAQTLVTFQAGGRAGVCGR